MDPEAPMTISQLTNAIDGIESKKINLDSRISSTIASTISEEVGNMFMEFMWKPPKETETHSPPAL